MLSPEVCPNRCCWGFSYPLWPPSLHWRLGLWGRLFGRCPGYTALVFRKAACRGRPGMITPGVLGVPHPAEYTQRSLGASCEVGLRPSRSLEPHLTHSWFYSEHTGVTSRSLRVEDETRHRITCIDIIYEGNRKNKNAVYD